VIDRIVDRSLHTVGDPRPHPASDAALHLHARIPVVDLLVGTVLFRRTLLERSSVGHVDLPRLRQGGVNLVGMSIATRFPDRRGTLSAAQFLSLGVPARVLGSDLGMIEHMVGRIDAWAASSGGHFRVVRCAADLDAVLAPGGPVGAFVGVQGGQVLAGAPDRMARALVRLRAGGVRMLALAHVMDNPLAGSGTGRRAGGLTPPGRRAIAGLETSGILVDLAHASSATIRDAVPMLTRPPVLSHTGFVERAGRRSRWRRYSAASRNVHMADARLVSETGGVVGVTTSASLLGGDRARDLVDTVRYAIDELGAGHVAIGSDMDGALRSVIDAAGFPVLTDGLLAAGVSEADVAAVMGGNAIRMLRAVMPV
jgi:membrane dipeptidase